MQYIKLNYLIIAIYLNVLHSKHIPMINLALMRRSLNKKAFYELIEFFMETLSGMDVDMDDVFFFFFCCCAGLKGNQGEPFFFSLSLVLYTFFLLRVYLQYPTPLSVDGIVP